MPARLKLNRGDIGSAQEKIMVWHEQPGCARPGYLFKLKLTANVRRAIGKIPWPEWSGQPWLGSIAPQLDPQQRFERYLCWHNPLSPDDWPPKPAS